MHIKIIPNISAKMPKIRGIITLTLSCLLVAIAPFAQAQSVAGSPYINSWIGNDFGLPEDHIPHNFDNICVTPSGKVATIVGWEEGGHNAAFYSSSGAKIGIPVESGTGSWGRNSGSAVFVNENYLYQSMTQDGGWDANGVSSSPDNTVKWACVRRYNHDGSDAPFTGGLGSERSYLVVNTVSRSTGSALSGILAYNGELYVSDPDAGEIKVYNATTMSQTPVRALSIANPGSLDIDRLGFIWMLDTAQKKMVRFSTTGVVQSQSISFPAEVTPTTFCVDKVNDRILVCNNGNDQNVLIYTNIFTTPIQTATFGATGGINSGIAGVIAPLKFSEPRGVGIDSAGNIFIANNGVSQGGGRLEKYNSSGVLQWRLSGYLFTANGSLNPADETELYTPEFRIPLNLNNTVPGTEWSGSSSAMTLNKVKYPEDARIATQSPNILWTTPYVRVVSGRKLLFVQDMGGGNLQMYRFKAATDGETAIPSGHLTGNDLWRDTNGNGAKETAEKVTFPTNYFTGGFFPDANAGIWKADTQDIPGRIRRFPLQGFDVHGNPIYTIASSVTYDQTALYQVRNLEYDAANDVLYAIGRSTSAIPDAWVGDRMVRFNNFTNPSTRTVAWSINLPFSNNGSPATDTNIRCFSLAGDYVFIAAARNGIIHVHRKSDGVTIGDILPTVDTGNKSGWFDIWGAVQATLRPNGEYLIFAEENGFGKVMMYRWRPGGSFPDTGKLTGTAIGTTGVGSHLREAAFDGNRFSFYDATSPNGHWVGLDLGTAFQISSIRYYPRGDNLNGRMLNGIFQGSNTADFSSGVVNLHTITSIPSVTYTTATISNNGTFRYVRYLAPNNSFGNVAEIQFYRSVASSALATFRSTYGLAANGSQDSLTPAGDGVQNLLKYAFNMLGNGTGQGSNLSVANRSVIIANGSAGLPLVDLDAGKLRVTFVRRISTGNPGVGYAVEFSDTLVNGTWVVNGSATTVVTNIEATFERVVVTDNATSANKRFVRTRVTVL